MTLCGKVVVITGASRGIGQACASAFERRGALLSLTARSSIRHPTALITQADVTKACDRETIVRNTLERFGWIDILVNNAGSGLYGPTETTSLVEAEKLFQLNFFAALAMTQLVLPHMRARACGHIVNVSSLGAHVALPWMTTYCASKAALSALSSGLRRELAQTGIRVTDVIPGYVATTFQGSAVGKPPKGVLKFRRRAIAPEQAAEAIASGVERNARTVVTPASGSFAILAEHTAPWMIDSTLSKMNR